MSKCLVLAREPAGQSLLATHVPGVTFGLVADVEGHVIGHSWND